MKLCNVELCDVEFATMSALIVGVIDWVLLSATMDAFFDWIPFFGRTLFENVLFGRNEVSENV